MYNTYVTRQFIWYIDRWKDSNVTSLCIIENVNYQGCKLPLVELCEFLTTLKWNNNLDHKTVNLIGYLWKETLSSKHNVLPIDLFELSTSANNGKENKIKTKETNYYRFSEYDFMKVLESVYDLFLIEHKFFLFECHIDTVFCQCRQN